MAGNSLIKLNLDMVVNGQRQVGEMTVGLDQLGKAASRVQASFDKVKFTDVINASASLGTAVGNLVSSLDFASEGFRSFDSAMRAANTMAGKSGKDFDGLKDSITALGKEVPIARDALANGLYQAISNGVPEGNWIDFLRDSAKASVGGMADLGGVVTVTSTIIKNYGMAWEEAGAIQEKIQKTAQYGVTSFEQLQQALPKVTGNAATLGVSIDELMASFATLTGVSGNTAEVATQMAAIFTALVKPSSQATKMAQEMGIQFDAAAIKAAGGFQNFLTTLDESVKSYAQTSGMLEKEIYGKLFGSAESLRALGPLTGQLADTFALNVDRMGEDSDALGMAFENMAGTAESAAQLMKNRWASFTDAIGAGVTKLQPFISFTSTLTTSVSGVVAFGTAMKGVYISAMKTRQIPAIIKAIGLSLTSTSRAAVVLRNTFNMTSASAKALGITIKGAIISTGIGVAIVAITTAIEHFSSKTDKAAEKAERLKEATKGLADELNGSFKNAAAAAQVEMDNEIKKLEALITAKGNTAKAVSDLNKKYGEIFGTYKTAAEWYDILTKKSKTYAQAIGYEALAREASRKAAEADITLEQLYDRRKSINRQKQALKNNGKYKNWIGKTDEAIALDKEAQQVEEQITTQTQLLAQANSTLEKAQTKGEELMKTLGAKTVTPNVDTDGGKGKAAAAVKADPTMTEVLTRDLKNLADYNQAIADMGKLREKAAMDMLQIIDEEIKLFKVERDAFEFMGTHGRRTVEKAETPTTLPVSFTLPVKPTLDLSAQKAMQTEAKEMLSKMPTSFEWAKSAWGNVNQLTSSFESLSKVIDKDASVWERLQGVVGGAMGLFEGVTSLMRMMEVAQQASTAAKIVDTTVTNDNTTAKVANAAAGFMSAYSWIPWVGVGLAAASIAMMVAQMAGLPTFADGGIAYGPTLGLFGEYAGAKSNPEVVAPLDRLRDLMDDTTAVGEVEFVIRADTLYGILKKREKHLSRN